jgi:hypothetical protein
MSKQNTKAAIGFFARCWNADDKKAADVTQALLDKDAANQREKQWIEAHLSRAWRHEDDANDCFYPFAVGDYGDD